MACFVCRVLQDGVGLPERQIAVHHGRQRRVGVQTDKGFQFLFPLEVVNVHQLVRGTHQLQSSQHFFAIDGDRVCVNFHVVSVVCVVS